MENKDMSKPLAITELVLRDAHQSLLATRLRIEDMLPIAEKLDSVGYWSLETWGGATFDSCIRFLGEDPWERLRTLKKAMPKTPQQMLLRGQNLLGYRHYADDVVTKFVERAHDNGMDVFRIFDAMNDVRNFQTAVKAAVEVGAHAQGTMSYTTSPVHTQDMWVDLARRLEDLGCHSICIKDMSGLMMPNAIGELIPRIKEHVAIPIHLHCHATTGLSLPVYQKAIEAGIDMVDTAISSMSMTYGHNPTETVVAMLQGTERDTGLDLTLLEEIAAYFRNVRKKYAEFEGSLRGVDSRILLAQVPGGMLTNMESQLKQQGAADRLDEVLDEIPNVRKDLGYIPLVTPTSQIVGTQAVLNVLMGERYKSITKETAGVLKGEYGASPAPVNEALQQRVLADGEQPITCRPADKLVAELDKLEVELDELVKKDGLKLADNKIDDVLTYALFPQIGAKFLAHRGEPSAFEPAPGTKTKAAPPVAAAPTPAPAASSGVYTVTVEGKTYTVEVADGNVADIKASAPTTTPAPAAPAAPTASAATDPIAAPLAGNIFKIQVSPGDLVNEGDVIVILEAMKMETEIRAPKAGKVANIRVKEGDAVAVGDELLALAV